MSRRALGILLVAVGAVFTSPLADAVTARDPAKPPEATAASLAAGPERLPDSDRLRALSIAQAHPAVRALTAGRVVSSTVVPWTTLKRDRLLGAGVDLSWSDGRPVKANWPALLYDETERLVPPYVLTHARVHAENVTGVHVAVDLQSAKVVAISALPGAVVAAEAVPAAALAALPPQPAERR